MAGIYLHIPFCKQACNYCNFHFSTSLKQKEVLIDALIKEMELRHDYLQDQTIETIYFGGGTPSLLNRDDLNRIWTAIEQFFPNLDLQECTFEANPDDLNGEYLSQLAKTKINRLSIGVQSFFEEDLRFMRRAHSAQEAEEAIKLARDVGFSNFSIDLIYGVPTANDEIWRKNIQKAIDLGCPHISAYALTIEPQTLLAHQIKNGKTPAPLPESAAQQFDILVENLSAAGYDHYEISNFAKPGFIAQHNTNYWRAKPYLGLGPSAHSFDGSSRQWNISNNALYIKGVMGQDDFFEKELLSRKDQFNECILTNLRTMWGIELKYIRDNFGDKTEAQLLENAARFINRNQIIERDGCLILTKNAKLFADGIAADLFI